jgi:hypothetical protein
MLIHYTGRRRGFVVWESVRRGLDVSCTHVSPGGHDRNSKCHGSQSNLGVGIVAGGSMGIHNSMYNNKELSTLLNLVCSLFLFQILLFGDCRQNNFVTGIKIKPFFSFLFYPYIQYRKGVLSRNIPGLRLSNQIVDGKILFRLGTVK